MGLDAFQACAPDLAAKLGDPVPSNTVLVSGIAVLGDYWRAEEAFCRERCIHTL